VIGAAAGNALDEDVGGFEVAVDDASLVGVLDGAADVDEDAEFGGFVEVGGGGVGEEGCAVAVFEDEVGDGARAEDGGRARVVDLGDARVREASEDAGFALEAFDEVG
jgi:hypothetical protein